MTSRLGVVKKWASLFPSGFPEEHATLFDKDAEWFFYAFGVRRKGATALKNHFNIRVNSILDFTLALEQCWEVPEGVVAKFVGKGVMTKDLTNQKAYGTPFQYHGVALFRFRENLIVTLEEILTRLSRASTTCILSLSRKGVVNFCYHYNLNMKIVKKSH